MNSSDSFSSFPPLSPSSSPLIFVILFLLLSFNFCFGHSGSFLHTKHLPFRSKSSSKKREPNNKKDES